MFLLIFRYIMEQYMMRFHPKNVIESNRTVRCSIQICFIRFDSIRTRFLIVNFDSIRFDCSNFEFEFDSIRCHCRTEPIRTRIEPNFRMVFSFCLFCNVNKFQIVIIYICELVFSNSTISNVFIL